jgi:hypothetical protein
MTFLRRALVVAAALPLIGCFESATVIKIKADGSGTIEQRLLLTDAALEQLRGLSILSGGGDAAASDPTSEAQARALAGALGPGVTYVSSAPVKTAKGQGRDSVYAFTDITKLHVSEQPRMPGGVSVGPQVSNSNSGQITFTLTKEADGNSVLRIQVPRPDILPTGAPGAGAGGDVNAPSLQQIEMVKALLAGAHASVTIEPDGRLVQTNSRFVDGNRVTLFELDVDKMASDPDLAAKLQSPKSVDEAKAALSSVPGLKLPLDPEISITFAPN